MDITNKTLAMFLVAAIVISLAGTIISLNQLNKMTGYAVSASTGTARVNVSSTTSITFTTNTIDFGNGSINVAYNNCTMYANATNGTIDNWKSAGCTDFSTALPAPFTLENNGNPDVSVNLNSSTDAAGFLGGSTITPVFQYAVFNAESGSCGAAITPTTWADVNATALGTLVCSDFNALDSNDTLKIAVRIVIPLDASGIKTATFTATATG